LTVDKSKRLKISHGWTGMPVEFIQSFSSQRSPRRPFWVVWAPPIHKKCILSLEKGAAMSNKEALHQLYAQCKNINFDESYDLIASAEDSDEADFFRMATDLVLKQKQRKAVEENRF
jgi:hypothetical protein